MLTQLKQHKIINASFLTIRLLILMCIDQNSAFALDEMYSPNVEYRELSLEYNGSHTFDRSTDKNGIDSHELTLEAGLTPRWEVETSGEFSKSPDSSLKMNAIEIENRFQFFESGENWLDSGFLIATDLSSQRDEANSIEAKLLLQKDVNKITTTANLGFTQDVGHLAASGGPDYISLINTRYRYSEYFQPGIEIQSDLGQFHNLSHFNEQQHYIGPTIYGRLVGHLKYQAGLYAGISTASSQAAGRLLLEYEFHF